MEGVNNTMSLAWTEAKYNTVVRKLSEAEALRTTGFAVINKPEVEHLAGTAEDFSDLFFSQACIRLLIGWFCYNNASNSSNSGSITKHRLNIRTKETHHMGYCPQRQHARAAG